MYLLFFLLFSFILPLQAEKIIQCIVDFPVDPHFYTQVLQEKGYEGKVVITPINDYKESLLKRKGLLHGWLRKVHLDYPWKATVSEEVDKIVFFNIPPSVCRKYDLSRLPKEKMVLFMWEPKTVLKKMYRPEIQACFSKVYTWDDSLVDGIKYFKFNYPVLVPMIADRVAFEEKKLCTLVSSNLKGSGRNELYSKRKEAIAYFEQVKEEGFEFYGRRWDSALHSSYRGEIADKLQVMKNYRFCICYENTQGVDGYITEKIFDCFAAGVVPVYWGASNIETYIPKGCFIDRRDFNSLEELHAFMKKMTRETYDDYLAQIQLFLQSKEAQAFTFGQLAQHFYEAVAL